MVAVVAGNGLGLGDTSGLLLGSRGVVGDARLGRGNDRVYLNAATGNLVVQSVDELLLGRGLDVVAHRAYNSQGQFDYGNNDNWLSGLNKRIYGLTGTVNTAGSTVIRADWDGTETLYTYNTSAARYETKAGDGAHDFLTLSGSTWTWTNGDTRVTEAYDNANGGRITAQNDPSGNQITYTYNGSGQLTRVQTPVTVGSTNTTESVYLDYSGTLLTQVRTVYKNASGTDVTRTRVRYEYDASNRLSKIRVDLSPDDNSIATGTTYDTTYAYDGTSSRIASITQSDGAKLEFVYTQVGGIYRTTKITQTVAGGVTRVTNIAYDTANRTTTLTDPLNYATVFGYDASNRLTRITAPSVGGVTQTVQFGYDADGNVTTVTDAKGNVVTYAYNAQGLMTLQRDHAGNTVTRTYNANNQLESETVYFTPDPDGGGTGQPAAPATTRYIYDSAHRLRYILSAEGRVTEHRYSAQGLRLSSHVYTSDLYASTTYTESALTTWRSGLVDKSRVQITDYAYDYRGALTTETRSSRVRADGVASLDASVAEYSQTRYVYDSFGNLLQRLPTAGSASTEVYVYDGLGRQTSATDVNSALTITTYDDANNKTLTTFVNGLIQTRVFNKAGELISLLEGQGATTLSTTQYRYDALGRLRYTQDPTGIRTHILYDEASRKVAEIDADGSLTEYFYDANNLVIRTLRYNNKVSAANLTSLVDANGNPTAVALSAIRPSTNSADRSSWRLYDAANRLHKEVDARGAVVEYFYDGVSRLVKTTAWANFVNMTTFAATPTSANATPTVNAAADRTTRYLYDNDGLLRGTLDGEGFIVEHRYNAAGLKSQTWRYADAAASADRAAASLATLIANRGTANRSQDITEHFVYDGRGLLRSHFDGEGNRTEYAYDQYGNVRHMNRGRSIDTSLLTTPQSVTIQFQARATQSGSVWPTVQVRVDGVVVGTVTIGSATSATYTVTATGVVPAANHTVDFVYTNDDGTAGNTTTSRTVWISNGALKAGTYTQSFATASFAALKDAGSGTAAFDGASVTEVAPTTEQVLDVNGALRFTLFQWVNTSFTTGAAAYESTSYSYNAYGQLQSRTVALAGGTTETDWYTYDLMRQRTEEQRASWTSDERKFLVRYDVQGRVVMELGGRGAEALAALGGGPGSSGSPTQAQIDAVWNAWAVKYAYDSAGRRISMTDANGNKTLYYYNGDGKLTHTIRRATDAAGTVFGEVVENRYDAFNNLSDTIVYGNRLSAATFNGLTGGLVTTALTNAVAAIANGASDTRTQLVYNTTGTVQARREYTGASAYDATTFSYNAFYQETGRTSPTEGSTTVGLTTAFDRRGLATSSTLDSGGLNIANSTVYDAFGRITQTTDGRGIVRTRTYDRAGRVVQAKDGNTQTESLTYDSLGNVLTRTDRRGQVTTYAYEPFGRKVTVTTPEGIQTVTTYNAHGHVGRVQILGVAGNDTVYAYDRDGNLKSSVVANGSLNLTTTSSYDNAGRLTTVVDARGTSTTYAYDAANRVLTRTVDPGGLNLITRYAYDGKGQAISVTDAAGAVTTTTFDAKGQKTQVAVDPTGLNLRTTFAYDKRGNALTVTEGAGTAEARVTQYTYDKAGRLSQTQVDPAGLNIRTEYTYDKNGNVTFKRDANGNTTRYLYDNENRLTHTVDPIGAVTESVYDAAGNLIHTKRYANSIVPNPALADAQVKAAIVADAARDRITSYAYDKDNRRVYARDALGGVTQYKYDAAGNVIQQTQYANRISTSAAPIVGSFSGVTITAEASLDRTTRYAYDEANRLRYTLDAHTVSGGPGGLITENVYDANGNVARIIQWGNLHLGGKTIAGNPTVAQVAALFPVLTNLSHTDRVGAREQVFTYDKANRRIHVLNSWTASVGNKAFVGTEVQYDALGRVVRTTGFAHAIWAGELPALTTVSAVGAKLAAAANTTVDRTTLSQYDTAGRLKRTTDGEGFVRLYDYDAVGNKIAFTNERGSVWNYEYDRAGRLTIERSPSVSIVRLTGSANSTEIPGVVTDTVRIVTQMTYDALGNVITRWEGLNNDLSVRPESRRTSYAYDALGRQTTITYEAVGIYNAGLDNLASNGWNGSVNTTVNRTEDSASRQSETRYNTFGEAVVNRDVAGGWSYKTYDRLGRLVYEIDPTRAVSAYTYSTKQFEWSKFSRYAGTASLTDGFAVAAAALESAASAAGAAQSAQNRAIKSVEDRLGRVVRSEGETNAAFHFDASASAGQQVFSHGGEQRYDYNAYGDVIRARTLLNPLSGAYSDTYYYYELHGRVWREIDSLGFVTDTSISAFGDLTRTYEYAQALTPGTWGFANGGAPVTITAQSAPDSAIGHDRELQHGYDRKGQKVSDVQVAVQFSRNPGPLTVERIVNHVVTTYTYDGAGNVVFKNDYTVDLGWTVVTSGQPGYSPGNGVYYFYNAVGHRELEVQSSGATVRTQSDALGNAVVTTKHFASTTVIWPGGEPRPTGYNLASPHGSDQTTYRYYDKLGRVLRTVEPTGANAYFSYNARGDVAKEWRPFNDFTGALRQSIRVYNYDAVGRQIETKTLNQRYSPDPMTYTSETARYNAFGEIVAKGLDGTDREFNEYDNAGRVWRSNAGDGVYKIIQYDLQGNLTRQIISPTVNLKTYFGGPDIGAAANDFNNYRVTTNILDKQGRVLTQYVPVWSDFSGGTRYAWIPRTYDRWGNVVSQANMNNGAFVTNYRYNALNQIVFEQKPSVEVWTEQGSMYGARPTTTIYYDAWGRRIALSDAAGRFMTWRYDALGRMTDEYFADGGRVSRTYDHLNRELGRTDQIGRLYTYVYDKADRRLEDWVTQGGSSYLLAQRTFDQLGNRTSETTGQDDAVANATTRYLHDGRGNVIAAYDPYWNPTSYYYDSRGNLALEVDALNSYTYTTYDYFGRLVGKRDMGGADYSFTYNLAGQLTTQTNNRGQSLSYTYYANGLIRQITDNWRNSYTQYDYDFAGNRTRDIFVEDGVIYRYAFTAYDSNDRLISVIDSNWTPDVNASRYALFYRYDANGNKRQVHGSYMQANNSGRVAVDNVFAYDAMNRVTVENGIYANGTVDLGMYRSYRYSYDLAGRRVTSMVRFPLRPSYSQGMAQWSYGDFTEYSYDVADRVRDTHMSDVDSNGAAFGRRLYSRTTYDPNSGRQTTERPHYPQFDYYGVPFVDRRYISDRFYDANGRIADDLEWVEGFPSPSLHLSGWVPDRNPDTSSYGWLLRRSTYGYDVVGNVSGLRVESHQELTDHYSGSQLFRRTAHVATTNYQYAYAKMDGYRERYVSSASTAVYQPNTTYEMYDANGQLLHTFQTLNPPNSATWLITDHAGHVVQKLFLSGAIFNAGQPFSPEGVPGAVPVPQGRPHPNFVYVAPPPPPPPPPVLPPPPPPPPIGPPTTPGHNGTINAGEALHPGFTVYSPNSVYRLTHEGGRVSLYRVDSGIMIWSTPNYGTAGYLLMNEGGFATLFSPGGDVLYQFGDYGNPPCRLVVEDSGNMAILNAWGGVVWQTGTWGWGIPSPP